MKTTVSLDPKPLKIEPEMPPIVVGEDGTARILGQRLPLEIFVEKYDDGAGAERLHQAYPWLSLGDIHGVIAWVLEHRAEVDEYVAECDRLSEVARRRGASITMPPEKIEEIKARWADMQKSQAAAP